jgi:hypothetical protein
MIKFHGGSYIHIMLKGIVLHGRRKQQNISQDTNDSSFMVLGDNQYVDELVRLLKIFSEVSKNEDQLRKNHTRIGLISTLSNHNGL